MGRTWVDMGRHRATQTGIFLEREDKVNITSALNEGGTKGLIGIKLLSNPTGSAITPTERERESARAGREDYAGVC